VNLPNMLSLARLLMAPLFAAFFLSEKSEGIYFSAAVLLVSGVTDIADGYFARRLGLITRLGKVLDPLADKLMQATVFACLYMKGVIPFFVLALYILKEALMLLGGALIIKDGRSVPQSKWYGKLGTTLFYAVCLSLMLFDTAPAVKTAMLSAVIVWAFCCGVFYLISVIRTGG